MGDLLARLSLRARMVLLASAVVAVVLSAAALLLGLALRVSLSDGVGEAAAVRAREIAALARAGALPAAFPVSDDDEALVQVVDGGDVVASSANVAGQPALALPSPPGGEVALYAVDELDVAEDDGGFMVAAVTTATPAGPVTVYVAASLEDVQEAVSETAAVALTGLPVVIAILAMALWLLVGRTLRPVERIRAEADAIGGGELHRRVPEPRRDDEVGRLARTLNAMLARVERNVEQQRRFVADAAHELRTPVASVRAQLETARRPGAVDWQARSETLLADTVRMQQLIEQLLLLARLDAGTTLERRPVDLDDAVLSAAARLPPPVGVALDVAQVQPLQVRGSPALLEQLVANLLDNAARHAAGRMRLSTWADDGDAFVQVEDDGPGIPVDRRDAVLRRFVRLDEGRDRGRGGVGLGLAIVADIARAHGGRVEVGDSDLGGARFVVRLPLDPGPAPPHRTRSSASSGQA